MKRNDSSMYSPAARTNRSTRAIWSTLRQSVFDFRKTNADRLKFLTKIYSELTFDEALAFEIREGALPDLPSFLVSTTQGLLKYENGVFRRILGGSLFGITLGRDGMPLLYQGITGIFGRIVRFDLETETSSVLVHYTSSGIHQIDMIGNRLVVCNTYDNFLSEYDVKGRLLEKHFIHGRRRNVRRWEGYNHFNSIFADAERLYIVAHNETSRSDRKSEIYELDRDWNILEIHPTSSSNAHNIVRLDGEFWHCNSMAGELLVGDSRVFRNARYLTRGLAINDQFVLLGGSAFANRTMRGRSDSLVYVMNRRFERLCSIYFPSAGNIKEIRFLKEDLGLSNTSLFNHAVSPER